MTDTSAPNDPIITIRPSQARYGFGLVMIGCLSAVLLWVGLTGPDFSLINRLLVLAPGLLLAYLCFAMWKAGRHAIVLTDDGVFDTAGNALCSIEQIKGIDRSFFAFKPSNGFIIQLKAPMPRAWLPGIWWRVGKNVGIGGIIQGGETKAMSDVINMMLHEDKSLIEAFKNR